MPMYEYHCPDCNKTFDKFLPLAEYNKEVKCEECGNPTKKVISANVHGDEAPWLASTTEMLKSGDPKEIYRNPVSSRKEYNELLKKKGLTPVG